MRGQSRPWQHAEIEAANTLRVSLHNVVLRQSAAEEREKATRQQEMLMAELDHRVKNMLATIQSLARQSKAGETTLSGFLRSFDGRLRAMSRAHNVLTASRWTGVDLATMISEELEPYAGGASRQLLVNAGSNVLLRPKAALAMCLAIHELATNAGKYGALSVPGGRVEVDWDGRQRTGDMLVVTWHEHGGPPVHKPARSGFGTKLITTSLSYEIDGDVEMSFPAEGVICRISIPWPQVVESSPAAGHAARPPERPGNGLQGARVLVVEDNAMLAMELVEALEDAGGTVVGPAPRLPATPAEPPPPTKPDIGVVTPPPPPAAEAKPKPLPPIVFFVGAGLTVAAGGLTIWSGIDTVNNPGADAVRKQCAGQDASCPASRDGRSAQLRTNVLIGATAGLGVLSGVAGLFFTEWRARGGRSARVDWSPSGVTMSGRF